MSTGLAVTELSRALAGLGIHSHYPPNAAARPIDLVIEFSGREAPVQVKARSTVAGNHAASLVSHEAPEGPTIVVVADRVLTDAREVFLEHGWGWFDRRGHLRISAPGVLIDTAVESTGRLPGRIKDPFAGQVAREVASLLLVQPDESFGVREIARQVRRSPSTVSTALQALREHGVITARHQPLIPELFWELADHWSSPRHDLGAAPAPGQAKATARLGVGLDDVEATPGWALTDTVAAAAYGAPVATRSDAPPDFYVPSRDLERLAVITLGTVPHRDRACTVRAAPARWACERRIDGARVGASTHWPLAHPLLVALDLAGDPGRGREILEAWAPPPPWQRVW